MRIKKISATLSVTAQISADQMQILFDQGFRSIICNRPDGEAANQQSFKEIEKAALNAGLKAQYIPIGGPVTREDVALFSAAMQELPKPMLAYCRSGARSSMLWSLCQAGK